ncbi:MAG: M23 family metallopeptidase [Anaerolineae bacterium]|nr:M23 family metallopeptidase [Anaerolineae bacterium]
MRATLTFFLLCLILSHSETSALSIEIPFEQLAQGEVGVIHLSDENIMRVRAAFLDGQYFFPGDEQGDFMGFIGVPLEAEPGFHRLSLLVFYADGTQEYFWKNIQVIRSHFPRSTIYLPANLSQLLQAEIIDEERIRLDEIIRGISDGGNWPQTGLIPPLNKTPSDTFGTIRYFNGDILQRHTGIDYALPIGTPLKAVADGIVVLSDSLPIRGSYVLIDHGSGLFTGYAHLSERWVVVGDEVKAGQIIGSSGNTGRSTGPHLHWETAIGGTWVNPISLTIRLNDE